MYICLWSAGWTHDDGRAEGAAPSSPASAGAATLLTDLAPRLRVEPEVIWADGRGLDAAELARGLIERLAEAGIEARAGVARVPIVAELAARAAERRNASRRRAPPPSQGGGRGEGLRFLVRERTAWGHRAPHVPHVPQGRGGAGRGSPSRGGGGDEGGSGVWVVEGERSWLAALPLRLLVADGRLAPLLDGVGLRTVGELAALEREAVEVRFGPEAVGLWRLARGDDRRVLFHPVPPERPHGSIDFVDYVLTDPARLVFTANALLGPLCDRLVARGEHARALRLVLPLANGEAWERTIRPARPTASRERWLRLIRGLLERLTVPDAVTGMLVEVWATEPAAVLQGDLFDRGFATASAVEAALARLAEQQAVPLEVETGGHPLIERRSDFRTSSSPSTATSTSDGGRGVETKGGLALQLLPAPRRLLVEVVRRRDHEAPVRLRDRGGWREVVLAAGPDRISGGRWEAEPYAREYYRCVTDEGVPLWVYRDGRDGEWYLHGWWD
jgi:hypothetical protein